MLRNNGIDKTGSKGRERLKNRLHVAWLVVLAAGFLAATGWRIYADEAAAGGGSTAATTVAPSAGEGHYALFEPFTNGAKFTFGERASLIAVLLVAIAGLFYARMLAKQVKAAEQGTPKMQEIARAVREGADAYLWAQFKKIALLIVIITGLLFYTKYNPNNPHDTPFAIGRAAAFLIGSVFSWLVGFVGMKMATIGNLRVAAAAKRSYGEAMQLGYRTGTITGMLTDGLGLLGGTCIFLVYGEQAYEALLGFGFGGTLLALFMRVGGGIYTKAADVGADLVGKVEAGIPEDDPRNAATIADNVGDNVGDCAGMAADIFESYEVTIVAAMILGMASFGHKGVIFPLLVRGIGVLGSIISTYTVKAGPNDTSDTALKSVHRGFWIGSAISVVGFVVAGLRLSQIRLGLFYSISPGRGRFPVQQGGHTRGLVHLPRGRRSPDHHLLHRHRPGDCLEQAHQLLHPHVAHAGEEPGASLSDGRRHEYHPGTSPSATSRP